MEAIGFARKPFAPAASATVVEFQTVLGNFSVNLFDDTTPQTVANFLDYVNNGAYTNSIVHRVVPDFVVQGGGFVYDGSLPVEGIMTNDPVANEPALSNLRGTIAMAKVTGQPDSATSQWFINLVDNQDALDGQNGGFTVFGIVMDDGMDIVDAIVDIPRFTLSNVSTSVPLRDVSDGTEDPDEDNFVIVNAIVVTDSATTTNTDLLPPENTIITTPPAVEEGGSGGGAPGLPGLAALALVALRSRLKAPAS
jgi:peptidyl-prolyl cis-trans isomerase A (cyclophilin A)